MPESSSFASPYTSIGSQSSYKNISQLADKNYSFLSYKAEVLRNDQENKSKAVMEALKCLQEKIQYLESDRDQAEQNLKSLANEAQTYKQKLLSNNGNTFEASTISKNLDLEDKLECAKKRCEILEKQLDTSRTMMFGKRIHSPSNKTNVQPLLLDYSNSKKLSAGSTISFSAAPLVAVEQLKNNVNEKSFHELDGFLPTIEKVNKLQEEHLKLSASQALTENKIQQLEKKIQEAHKKKQVPGTQQNVDDSAMSIDGDTKNNSDEINRMHKKQTKTKVNSDIMDFHTMKSKSSKLSNDHYLMKYTDIPFVVGKSSGKSHSLGANIQSVLSILKLHNNLCHKELKDYQTTSDSIKVKQKMTKYDKKVEDSISVKDIEILLGMLQDELAQLGFAHHEVSSQIDEINNEKQEEYRKMLDRMEQKMELKSNQIHIIKSHIENHKKCSSKSRIVKTCKVKDNSQDSKVKGDESQDTMKSKDSAATSRSSINPHLIMLKKSKLLQQTLRKGDLHWE
ncbi:centrosomal protein cep57l1 isoform X1 [Hydra vulgaris]|uniref:centrosomal protein cep57l1 isoform X1 n=1 Tax=Hydra vulgaris TaxID=6087 RepID=UPI001F5F9AF8|nr:centrosomal protein cep57l1 [Hydra vulgaris]